MKINVFEGARRLALLAGVVAAAVILLTLANSDPYVVLKYRVDGPGAEPVAHTAECPSSAASTSVLTETPLGRPVLVDLCLPAMDFPTPSGGTETLIPYLQDAKGTVWGAVEYSAEVSDYKELLKKRFHLSDSAAASAEAQYREKRTQIWQDGLLGLAVGLAVFWTMVWTIGWVVRGFLGIPRGKDHKTRD